MAYWTVPSAWYRAPKLTAAKPEISTASSPASGLGLTVRNDGRWVWLAWNREAAEIKNSSKATLYINDGNRQIRLDLSPEKLAAGKLRYLPEEPRTQFQLIVSSPAGETTASIEAPGSTPLPSADPPKVISESSPQAIPEALPKPVGTAPKPEPVATAAISRRPRDAKPSPFDSQPRDSFNSSDRTTDSAAHSYVSVGVEPVSNSFLGKVVRKVPLIRRLDRPSNSFVPPKPRRLVRPTLGLHQQAWIQRDTPVDVRVHVTSAGLVDETQLLSGVAHGEQDFAVAALEAARRWTFTPARDGDENVPAAVILHFDFRPSAGEAR